MRYPSFLVSVAQPGLYVSFSNVQVNGTRILGGSGNAVFSSETPFHGAPGLLANNSTVRIARSELHGGGGSAIGVSFGEPQDGGPAVASEGSTLYVRGGPASATVGGAGASGSVGGQPFGLGGVAIALDATSVLTATPDAPLAPGADGDGQVTAPAVATQGGTFSLLAERLATLAAAPSVAALGATVTLGASGEPAGHFLGFFSFGQGPALAVPGVPGEILLDLGAYAALPALALDGAGLASLAIGVPEVPALAGATLLVQGLSQSPAGTLSISSPTSVGIAP